jgi:class 3 adenylate cyclase
VKSGRFIDATASSLSLFVLGAGLVYSFYKYGNQFLIGLTGLTILPYITRQYYVAFYGSPTDPVIFAFFLADSTMLILLFIALAVAWGLSDVSRLRPVGISANVNIVAMFFDLRGSTKWAEEIAQKDFHYVRTFIDELREWTWSEASTLPHGRPNLIKFLGDGLMFVWEIPNGSMYESTNAVVGFAYTLHTNYPSWVKEKVSKQKFLWGVPDGIGAGVDVGAAIRLTFENGSDDYLGSPVNTAAKMQNLARPYGGVVIRKKVWDLLDDLRDSFPKAGTMSLGDLSTPIRMTEQVEF